MNIISIYMKKKPKSNVKYNILIKLDYLTRFIRR